MSALAVSISPRLAQKLIIFAVRQCRVGVDVADQFLDSQIPAFGQGELGRQLGDVGADQVRAEQLPVRTTGLIAALQGGYVLAQASRNVDHMATAIAMALARIRFFGDHQR